MRYANELLKSHHSLSARLLSLYPLPKGRHKLATSVIKRHSENSVWDTPDHYEMFIDAAMTLASQAGTQGIQKLAGLNSLYASLNTLGYLSCWEQSSAVLFDESLCQKLFGLVSPAHISLESLNGYLDSMPLPDFLVHCETDFDRHLAQFKARSQRRGYKVRNSQYYLGSDEALAQDLEARRAMARYVAERLEARGVQVLYLDLGQPINANLGKLNALLTE